MSMIFRVDIKSVKKVLDRLDSALMPSNFGQFVEGNKLHILKVLEENTPVQTGQMKASWKIVRYGKGVKIDNTAPHFKFVDRGTRSHSARRVVSMVVPLKKGKRGKLKGQKRGRDYVMAKRVAGIKARKILEKSLPKIAERLVEILEKEVNRITK